MEEDTRKRVVKACDRCRVKKSKCDGGSFCHRCKADNVICIFVKPTKTPSRVISKEYVELLENQQERLITGLQDLFKHVQPLKAFQGDLFAIDAASSPDCCPLAHEILDWLDGQKIMDGNGMRGHDNNNNNDNDINDVEYPLPTPPSAGSSGWSSTLQGEHSAGSQSASSMLDSTCVSTGFPWLADSGPAMTFPPGGSLSEHWDSEW